jgi:hypothetical protein
MSIYTLSCFFSVQNEDYQAAIENLSRALENQLTNLRHGDTQLCATSMKTVIELSLELAHLSKSALDELYGRSCVDRLALIAEKLTNLALSRQISYINRKHKYLKEIKSPHFLIWNFFNLHVFPNISGATRDHRPFLELSTEDFNTESPHFEATVQQAISEFASDLQPDAVLSAAAEARIRVKGEGVTHWHKGFIQKIRNYYGPAGNDIRCSKICGPTSDGAIPFSKNVLNISLTVSIIFSVQFAILRE